MHLPFVRNPGYTSYVALWRPPRGQFPQAKIEYLRLRPGYKFNRDHAVARYVGRLKFGGARPRLADEARTVRNRQGYLQYHRFTLAAVPCVGFVQDWRNGQHREGPRRMSGYFCDRGGGDLSAERIARITRAVTVRDAADDAAPMAAGVRPDSGSERRLAGTWHGYAETLSGIVVLAPDGRPSRAWFALPAPRGECRADAEISDPGNATAHMRLFCTNGRKAMLELRRLASDAWRAEGRDGRGNRITLDVEP